MWDGHRNRVDSLAFSGDSKRLITVSERLPFALTAPGRQSPGRVQDTSQAAEVLSWDASTWKQPEVRSDLTVAWPNIGISSPEHGVYTSKKNGEDRFKLYDSATGKLLGGLSVPENQDPKSRGIFSPDGKFLMLAGNDEKGKEIERLFAVPSGKLLCQLPAIDLIPGASLRPLAFSSDGSMVALFGREDGQIRVFETATGKLRYSLGNAVKLLNLPAPANLAFSRDNTFLASWLNEFPHRSDSAPPIRVWDLATTKVHRELPLIGGFNNGIHFAWSPDGRMLAIGQNGTIRLWELATLQVRKEFGGHDGDIRALAFSPDGRLLASGSADTTVLVWDIWGR
jgi:WD40 repeat protein